MNEITLDIETTGLSPFECRITCIGCKTDNEEKMFLDIDEKKLLQDFWKWIGQFEMPRVVGFNVYSFDIRWIYLRSMKYDLEITKNIKTGWTDLQYSLQFYNRSARGKLNDYGCLLGIGEKEGDGLGAIILWEEAKYDELKKYCLQDIRITYELYQKCKKANVI